ncbi:response regulator, partial [bacterium]|nr:response regulator [bacterium]
MVQADKQGTPYDVVFLDWKMPGMDGHEVARHIRGLSLAHIPYLIMVTGFGREEVTMAAKGLDVADFLIKPVSSSVLFE